MRDAKQPDLDNVQDEYRKNAIEHLAARLMVVAFGQTPSKQAQAFVMHQHTQTDCGDRGQYHDAVGQPVAVHQVIHQVEAAASAAASTDTPWRSRAINT